MYVSFDLYRQSDPSRGGDNFLTQANVSSWPRMLINVGVHYEQLEADVREITRYQLCEPTGRAGGRKLD